MTSTTATHERLTRYLQAIADSFGPDEGVEFTQASWASIRGAMLDAVKALSLPSASELPKQERHCSMCLRNTSRWPCNATHCPLRDNGPAASERALGHDQHSGSSCAAERMDANEGSTPSGSALCTRSATAPRANPIPLIKRLREQRDDVADMLREIVEDDFLAAYPAVEARAGALLKTIPTAEQQLRNIAEGIGMPYDDLIAALNDRADSRNKNG